MSNPYQSGELAVRDVMRWCMYVLGGLFLLTVIFGSFYTVEQSERAGVRRWGTVTTQTPVGPGLHFKAPIIDSVDFQLISLQTAHVQPFTVGTVDNQRVQLDINISYTVPEGAVFHMLYQVGKAGGGDINTQIDAIVRDRVSRVFSNKNTNYINEQREAIQAEVTKTVHDELNRLFKINIESVQIASITFSDAFNQSNEAAVQAKNVAIREENQKKVIEYQAAQKVITAQGERDQAIAAAEGRNKSAILDAEATAKALELQAAAEAKAQMLRTEANAKAIVIQAEADKKAAELRGAGDATAMKLMVDATGGPDKFIGKLQAEAQKNWNGTVPATVVGGGSAQGGATPLMPMFLNQQK